jgi:hypothetical protein
MADNGALSAASGACLRVRGVSPPAGNVNSTLLPPTTELFDLFPLATYQKRPDTRGAPYQALKGKPRHFASALLIEVARNRRHSAAGLRLNGARRRSAGLIRTGLGD